MKIFFALTAALAATPASAAIFDFSYTDHRGVGIFGPSIAVGQIRTTDELERVTFDNGTRSAYRITEISGLRNGEAMIGLFAEGSRPGQPGSASRPFLDPATLEIPEFYFTAGGVERSLEVVGSTPLPDNPSVVSPRGWKEVTNPAPGVYRWQPIDMHISANEASGRKVFNFSIEAEDGAFYGAGQVYADASTVLVEGRQAYRVESIKGFWNRADITGLRPYQAAADMYVFADGPLLQFGSDADDNGLSFGFDESGSSVGSLYSDPNSAGGYRMDFNYDGRFQPVRFQLTDGLESPAVGAVPEPATWAMMICGFGAIGGAMRRRPVQLGCPG